MVLRSKIKKDIVRYTKWDRVNAIVCSWILNSLSGTIYIGHACSMFALDIWTELYDTYYMVDGYAFFSIHQHIIVLLKVVYLCLITIINLMASGKNLMD